MMRYFYVAAPLLALSFAVQAQQQLPMMPKPPMNGAPMGDMSGSRMPSPLPPGMNGGLRMGPGHGLSESMFGGVPQDGPRAGVPPMNLPDSHMPPLPNARPQYTPGGQPGAMSPVPPQGQ